jgi:hypothetical protein
VRFVAATVLSLAVASLCACADVGRDATAAPQAGQVAPVSAVTVTFSDEVKQLAATDPRLTPDEVAIAIEHELQAHRLYAPAAANVQRSMAITVQNFTNSLASNTKILGYSSHNMMLNGTVQLQGAAAAGQPAFDVRARIRIRSRSADVEGRSLAQLYARFAVVTVAAMRGVEPPAP